MEQGAVAISAVQHLWRRLRAQGVSVDSRASTEEEDRLTSLAGANLGRHEGEKEELLGRVDDARSVDRQRSRFEQHGRVVAEVLLIGSDS